MGNADNAPFVSGEAVKKIEQQRARRKKAVGIAAAAAAAAATPAAAEVVLQQAPAEIPAPAKGLSSDQVPEPARFEYSKPRPLRTIGDFLKGALGSGKTSGPEQTSTVQNIQEKNDQIKDWTK